MVMVISTSNYVNPKNRQQTLFFDQDTSIPTKKAASCLLSLSFISSTLDPRPSTLDARPVWYCHKNAQNSQLKSPETRAQRRAPSAISSPPQVTRHQQLVTHYPPSVLINPSSIVKRNPQPRSSCRGLKSTYSNEVSLHRAPRPGKRPRAFPEYQLGGLVRLNKSLTLAAFHNAQPS
jgi:hypothetical protein